MPQYDTEGILLGRRDFLQCAATLALPLVLPPRHGTEPVTLVLLLPADAAVGRDSVAGIEGARTGIDEATHTYSLLRREIELLETDAIRPGALVVSLVEDTTLASALLGESLIVDARTRHDADACEEQHVFRIGSPSGSGDELLWHSSLRRFGATQLNDRFRQRTGRGMEASDWAGWFAVKLLAEAALRARTSDPVALAQWLLGPRARFDGHKGVPLHFDANRRLVQPRYLVAGDEVITLEPRSDCAA